MTIFLNFLLAAILVLSIVLFASLRKVGADATAKVTAGGDELSVADKQTIGGHKLWSALSVALIAVTIGGIVLINV